MSDIKYKLRGVSAGKEEVHEAIKGLDKGLYPNAFCKILPDHVGGDPDYCNIMHADTAGTKTSLAYIYWRETGDVSAWRGIVQDSIVMNLDDMACVGCVDNILLSSTIGRNKNLIDGECIKTIIRGAVSFVEEMAAYGVGIHLAGGETADVGDIVRTIDVGYTAFARMKRSDLIVNNIQAGQVIVGLASYGQATYEEEYNSGIGSNGLTSARHDVLNQDMKQAYPDSYDPNTAAEVLFCGSKKITDRVGEYSVGQLLLSPTRTYLPVIKQILAQHHAQIGGMIHCTGGAQTKVLHFADDVHIIKDNMLTIPPVFQLIQEESGTSWEEMYKVFNMGHRLEVYTDETTAASIIQLSESFNIPAQIVGRCEAYSGKQVSISTEHGTYTYR